VGTVGVIELKPNIINVVPGSARVTVDLRNPDNKVLIQAEKKLEKFLSGLESQQKVTIETTRLVRFQPVTFDRSIIDRIENAAKSSGYSCRKMTSGAGHDAQMMSRVCPTAMIFTPSVRGISHNPAEATKPEDIIAGAEVLLRTVVGLLEE
jgi:N-carbamoyl-L-amino-acid hydrolase